MPNSLKSGLVLLVLGIIMGALLAGINALTADRIENNEKEAKFSALKTFYDITEYDLTEVVIDGENLATVFVLKNQGSESIEALVYQVSVWGYSSNSPVTMLIAVNSDLSVEGYEVISHSESSGFGADIVDNDFNVSVIDDLSGFDAVAGVTVTSNAIKTCMQIVADRVADDFGGGLDD